MVKGENMKKALVDTQTNNIQYIASWVEIPNTDPKRYESIYAVYPNSCRVCEVVEQEFPVFNTLIWVDCADDVVADQYYYDMLSQTIKPIENAPYPIE